MKIKFNLFIAVCLFTSLFLFNYYMAQAGVPNGIILTFSMAYSLLFPWRVITVSDEEGPKEGESTDENNK